jgi:hypothetical protein
LIRGAGEAEIVKGAVFLKFEEKGITKMIPLR